MKSWKPKILVLLAIGTLYLAGPFIAGTFHIGDREGPFFYPVGLHTTLYIISAEGGPDGKPRASPAWILYHRPLFYGMSRKPKSAAERKAIIRRAEDNRSPLLEMSIKLNKEIDGDRDREPHC